MFGRKKKQAAREAALADEARRQDRFWTRATRIASGCDAYAVKAYRTLPAANSIRSCPKCGETNLCRTFLRSTVAPHRPLCQMLAREASMLDIAFVAHPDVHLDTLAVDCRSCGCFIGREQTADADSVIRTKEAAARRNGMGVPVHEGGERQ